MAPPPTPKARAPFVLLDDARAGGGARLYTAPREVVIARQPDEVEPALERIEALLGEGYAMAGLVAYEAGLALEPRLQPLAQARSGADGPLVWMGAFGTWQDMSAQQNAAWLAEQAQGAASIGPLLPEIAIGTYTKAFDAIHAAIHAGEIYQANLTFPLSGAWQGDPLALYAALRKAGGGAHGGILWDGSHWLLSLSPELFFTLQDGTITARPMKGTRPRGATPQEDAALATDLLGSEKDRAENLMIVDLLRNDLSRVAQAGSVKVERPFAIETYPTVHQMVSTVTARLADGYSPVDVLRAIFPCGSVTGAPKIRAMEWINACERDPRGAYCGSLGHIVPDKEGAGAASFNVAIRTLRLTPDQNGPQGGRAVMGVGSAVVADSRAMDEWRECLVKGGFVHQPAPDRAPQEQARARFDLIETMAFSPEDGIPLLELHLERMKASAAALGFSFDRHAARNMIHALCFEAERPSRLRLVLARSGATSLEVSDLPPALNAGGPVPCVVLPMPVDNGDWRLAHKTSDRWFYEAGLRAAREAGAAEALLIRDDGLLTEGCFTSLFVERDGVLLTPPLGLGLLPGVLRAELIAEGRARETELTLDDLSEGFLIGNALRGLMQARLLP